MWECWPGKRVHDSLAPPVLKKVHAAHAFRRGFGRKRRTTKALSAAMVAFLSLVWSAFPFEAVAAEPMPDTSSFLSRITIDVPFFTRHVPHPELFNNHNWGAFVDVALSEQWSIAAGDFSNSYKRSTIFAGLAWMPLRLDLSHANALVGTMFGFDVNGGYTPYNKVNPLLGAVSIRFTGAGFENDVFNRVGIAIKVIPPAPKDGSTAINFALSYKLE
jgi:hypothetical protein